VSIHDVQFELISDFSRWDSPISHSHRSLQLYQAQVQSSKTPFNFIFLDLNKFIDPYY
jgi:hypothetical protein